MPKTVSGSIFHSVLLLLFLCFFFIQKSIGQSFPDHNNWAVERSNIADQMGSTVVLGIAEDRNGYLWIGCGSGVARYDGYKLRHYTAIKGDTTSLIDSRVSFLFVDHTGILWIGTGNGLCRYQSETDDFKQYPIEGAPPNTMPDGEINCIIEDKGQQLWVGSQQGGLYRYHKPSDQFERLLYRDTDPVNLSNDQIRVLMEDRNGNIWIGTGEQFVPTITGGGVIRYNPETGDAKRYLHDPNDEFSLTDNRVSGLLQDRSGNIWIGSCNNGLHRYDKQNDRFIRMHPLKDTLYVREADTGPWSSCPHIRILFQDSQDGIWVGNFNGGLLRFDTRHPERAPRLFQHLPETDKSLRDNLVWTIFEDSQNRFWIGNLGGGLCKIDPFQEKFNILFDGRDVSAVYEAPSEPDVLWIGLFDQGIIRYDRQTKTYKSYQVAANPKKGLSSNQVYGFMEGEDGLLWIASDNGLSSLNRTTESFVHYPIIRNNKESVSIFQLYDNHKGTIWLGSYGDGLYKFDKKTSHFKHYPLPVGKGKEQNLYNQSVYALHEDAQGRLFIGTWRDGLYIFEAESERFHHYLDGIGVEAICQHSKEALWLGTESDGLLLFSLEKGILKQYDSQNGLASNRIAKIWEDKEGHVWVSMGKGIARINPKNNDIKNFTTEDGLSSNLFNDFSGWKALDGTIYFGSRKGLVEFRPEQIKGHPIPPEVRFQDIMVFDRSIKHLDTTKAPQFALPEKLRLAYHQNELTFEYVGLHYTAPERNQYRYRLIPYDQKWIEAGTKRSARYTNLNPGVYTFEVLASNSDGVWATEPARMEIRILPPWWNTWWAYLLYLIGALSLLYFFYSYQKRRWALQASLALAQEKSQRLHEIDRFKSRFYTNITHEFRTPLTVIQGLADQINDNPKWKLQERLQLIKRNSNRLLQLINQMLDLSKLESGKLHPNYVHGDIISYLGYLVESFHSLAFDKQINVSFFSHEEELWMDYDPEKIQKIIDNLVSNAIKFTPAFGKVVVSAKTAREKIALLQLEVKDTGIGIASSDLPHIFDRFYQIDDSSVRKAEGSGLGLALVKELVEIMGGTISVESQLEQGTSFIVELPTSQKVKTRHDFSQDMLPQSETNAPPLSISRAAPTRTDMPVILILEDNIDVIYYLKSCLEDQYQILTARDGLKGLALAFEHVPDIIVSDVMMPEMDGFEVCEKLKSDIRTSHIPVLLLTAKASQQNRVEGLSSGADAYLVKPFNKEELLVRLQNFLMLRERLQAYLKVPIAKDEPVSAEQLFLQKVNEAIEQNLDDADFNTNHLTRAVGMSRVQLHRKLKALTGLSTSVYIRTYRLQRAKYFLETTDLNITEVAFQTGFSNPSWFTQAFKQTFGHSPSDTRK